MSRRESREGRFATCGVLGIVFAAVVLILAVAFAVYVGTQLEFQN